jgi:Domain of unknown function (DUF4388)
MVELKGSLHGIGLPAIVQLIGELHHSGRLQLAKGTAHGLLGFDNGRLVLATYEQETGLRALSACARDLSDAEFRFVEGAVAGDGTLDLDFAEVQRQLSQLTNGTHAAESKPTAPAPEIEDASVCPLLGFADDRTRNYSRATALHRCFAGGAASLVTAQDQRELCLTDRFGTCARFRNSNLQVAAAPEPEAEAEQRPARPEVPPGVAARMAAITSMRVTYPNGTDAPSAPPPPPVEPRAPVPVEQESAVEQPPSGAQPKPDQQPKPGQQRKSIARPRLASRRPRSFQLIVGGTLLGIVALLAALVVVIPSFNSGLIPRGPTPEPPAFQGVPVASKPAQPTATQRATVPAPVPTLAPTIAPPTPTSLPQPTNTALPRPTVSSGGRTLLDLRLAEGPARNWRENPPYAGWSDGAYRLQARQAARFVAVGVPAELALGDVTVSATFRKTGGPPGGGYGLIVRDQGPDPRDGVNQNMSAYVLETGDLGEFGVWRRDGDHWFDLVPWTRSGAVHPGGSPNELSVRATADRLVFSANGVELATVQDDMFPAGAVGLFVGGDFNEVAVDRFAIQVPN